MIITLEITRIRFACELLLLRVDDAVEAATQIQSAGTNASSDGLETERIQ